ncbi:MAG: ArsR family transcriptional regulator [Syntrophobacteraceae bacterium]
MSTIRREIMSLLSEAEYGAKSISQILRISEKEVYDHLGHIGRSVKSQNRTLKIIEHIQDPEYGIEGL